MISTPRTRKFRLQHPERNHELQMKWRNQNKEKRRAHRMVEYHLKKGNLVKQPCEVCGDLVVHAHHDNYNEPLNVRWLCSRHHHDRHLEMKK